MIVVLHPELGELPVNHVIESEPATDEAAWYYGFNEDCFDPVRYLVRGVGWCNDERWQSAWNALTNDDRLVRDLDIRNCWGDDEVEEAAAACERGDYVAGTEINDDGVMLDVDRLVLWATPVKVQLRFPGVRAVVRRLPTPLVGVVAVA